MQGERLRAAVDGAAAFVAGMRPLDEAMLALFSDRLLAATPFTQDPQVLRQVAGRRSRPAAARRSPTTCTWP